LGIRAPVGHTAAQAPQSSQGRFEAPLPKKATTVSNPRFAKVSGFRSFRSRQTSKHFPHITQRNG
jgi:hypothetical protein